MKIARAREFTAERAWGAEKLAEFDGVTVRMHWTDKPYDWHVNDGSEVFTVLDGIVDMHYRIAGTERIARLHAADSFVVEDGDEHIARPIGEARVLVVEREGSA